MTKKKICWSTIWRRNLTHPLILQGELKEHVEQYLAWINFCYFLSFEFLPCLCLDLEGEVGKIVLVIMLIFSKVVRRSEFKEIVFVI